MRVIPKRPERHYADCKTYCVKRAARSTDAKIKWFWLGTAQWFEHMRRPLPRIERYRRNPSRAPDFKY